jgi:hypothetical protein
VTEMPFPVANCVLMARGSMTARRPRCQAYLIFQTRDAVQLLHAPKSNCANGQFTLSVASAVLGRIEAPETALTLSIVHRTPSTNNSRSGTSSVNEPSAPDFFFHRAEVDRNPLPRSNRCAFSEKHQPGGPGQSRHEMEQGRCAMAPITWTRSWMDSQRFEIRNARIDADTRAFLK